MPNGKKDVVAPCSIGFFSLSHGNNYSQLVAN